VLLVINGPVRRKNEFEAYICCLAVYDAAKRLVAATAGTVVVKLNRRVRVWSSTSTTHGAAGVIRWSGPGALLARQFTASRPLYGRYCPRSAPPRTDSSCFCCWRKEMDEWMRRNAESTSQPFSVTTNEVFIFRRSASASLRPQVRRSAFLRMPFVREIRDPRARERS